MFPVVWRRKQGNMHVFLDFARPEQVNTYVFPRRGIKSDCKRVYVKNVFPHLYAMLSEHISPAMYVNICRSIKIIY